jgi:hypothetical protein
MKSSFNFFAHFREHHSCVLYSWEMNLSITALSIACGHLNQECHLALKIRELKIFCGITFDRGNLIL